MPDSGQSSFHSPAGRATHPVVYMNGPGGKRTDVRMMLQVEEPHRRVRVLADMDYTKAFVHYIRLVADHCVQVAELKSLVSQAGVVHGIDDGCLAMLCEQINFGQTVGPFEVACATPPEHGRDGHLEFFVMPSSRDPRYEMDEGGNIDYRQLNLFENAVTDQPVATLHPPTKGKAGRDIRGQAINAVDGRNASFRIGRNIRLDEEKGVFFAEDDGRIVFENDRIELETLFEVHGDVDYNIGVIDFVGDVVVHGAVLDDFDIRGGKSVTIHGLVENCEIESDGNVLLLGGMAGKGKGVIRAGGLVKARYLNEVLLEAGGDVEVQNEIVNCTIRTSGRISMPRGTIVGGRVTAFRGIEVNEAGSDLGVPTRLEAGVEWTTDVQVEALDKKIETVAARIDAADAEIGPLLQDKKTLAAITDHEKRHLESLLKKLRAMRDELAGMEEERAGLLGQAIRKGQVSQINVNVVMHPGVIARFHKQTTNVKDPYRGPLSVVEDRRKEVIRVVPQFSLTDDDDPAREKHVKAKELFSR